MEKNFNITEWTLRDIARPLFRQKRVIIITIALITFITAIGLKMKTPIYEARVKMYIKGESKTAGLTYEGIGSFRIHLTQMEIVKAEPVLKRAVATLKLDERPFDYEKNYASALKKLFIAHSAKKEMKYFEALSPEERKKAQMHMALQDLKNNIDTELIRNTDIFYIIVTDFDQEKALEIANVVSRAYTIFDQQQQLAELALRYGELHPTVQQLRDNILYMNQNLSGAQLPDIEAIGTASVKIIEQATTDGYPVGKSKMLIFITAILGSIFVSIAVALLFDFADKTFHGPEDLARTLMIPMIGFIAHKSVKEKYSIRDYTEKTEYNDSYNKIIEQLNYTLKVKNLKSFLFCFYDDSNSNNYFIANIGYLLSKNYSNILIIDCSRNNKDLLTIIENEYSDSKSVENDDKIINRVNEHLTYIALQLDSTNPLPELQGKSFEDYITGLKNSYELVIIVCSQMPEYRDAVVVSKLTDGVIPVVQEGFHKKQLVISSIGSFKEDKINIIGTILNDRYFPIPDIFYHRM